jgi:hypothetical protein
MLRDGRSDTREVAARLLSELWVSGTSFRLLIILHSYHSTLELHGNVFTPETFTVFRSLLESGNDREQSFVLEFFFDLTREGQNKFIMLITPSFYP